ncbi:hypothetical protein B0H34DRAFT_671581 [Crassisporium funariophilum]|nr:hypothetical protein B0H34DRAFT_671581 [Crassisporium funariophilum]
MPPRTPPDIDRAVNDLEEGNSNDLITEMTSRGRWATRAISPFINLTSVLYAGMPGDDEDIPDPCKVELFKKIVALHPRFKELLQWMVCNEDAMKEFVSMMEATMNDAMSQDCNSVRYNIIGQLPLNPSVQQVTPPIVGSSKANRGWRHHQTAAALCPLRLRADFDEDPNAFCNKVLSGQITISAKDFPCLLYPEGTVYNPANIAMVSFVDTLSSEYVQSPSSALDGIRTASSASLGELNSLKEATAETVAYAALHAHFGVTGIERWDQITKEDFGYDRFFKNCVKVLSNTKDRWVKETLKFITDQTPSLNRRRRNQQKRRRTETDDEPDEADLLLKQREEACTAEEQEQTNNGTERVEVPGSASAAAAPTKRWANDQEEEEQENRDGVEEGDNGPAIPKTKALSKKPPSRCRRRY